MFTHIYDTWYDSTGHRLRSAHSAHTTISHPRATSNTTQEHVHTSMPAPSNETAHDNTMCAAAYPSPCTSARTHWAPVPVDLASVHHICTTAHKGACGAHKAKRPLWPALPWSPRTLSGSNCAVAASRRRGAMLPLRRKGDHAPAFQQAVRGPP